MTHRFALCAITIGGILVAACGESATPTDPITTETTGAIRVTVSMVGDELPLVYGVRAENRTVFADRGGAAVLKQLTPGAQLVQLQVPANCQADGENPRSVTVTASQVATVSFTVTCVSASGFVRVTAPTTGVDLDVNGYTITATGLKATGGPYEQREPVVAGVAAVFSVPVGRTTLTLRGIALNCVGSGSNPQTVTAQPSDTTSVAFPVECGQKAELAYVGPTGNGDIYVVYEDGSDVRRLTTDPSVESDPDWSLGGSKLAFTTNRDGNSEIYTMNPDGSGATRLTADPAGDYQPAWSPDGRKIAFASVRSGDLEVFVMNADGTNAARLTNSPGADYAPAWSPDGQRIAFTSTREGKPQVYVMNADGSEVTRLTSFAEGRYAAWSPDGSRIAFSALYCSAYYYYDACYPAVFIQTGSQISGIVVGDRPSWSPDGRKIAYSGFDCDRYYTSCVEGPFRIARVDGTDVVEVASGSAPTWRPR